MNKISFLFLLILSCSCSAKHVNEDEIIIEKFPKEANLSGDILIIPSILLSPSNMCIIDSFLIVSQNRPDSIFNIFRLPDCKHLKSFGNEGRGPEEFNLTFSFVTLGPVSSTKSSFAVGNERTNIQYYRISELIKNNYKPYKTDKLPPELNRFRAVTYLGDSLIFGASYRGGMHLFKFNSVKEELKTFRNYPDTFPLKDPEMMREPYACFLASKPDNSSFAAGYYHTGRLEIYNVIKGETIIVTYKGSPSIIENWGLKSDSEYLSFNPESMRFCERIVATNKYIYMSFANDKHSKIYNEKGKERTFIREIHVFDWDGNPIAKLRLDKFYSYFSIDNSDKYLYAIDEMKENKITRYDLGKNL